MEKAQSISKEQTFTWFFLIIYGNNIYNFVWIADITDRAGWVLLGVSLAIIFPLILWTFRLTGTKSGTTVFEIIGKPFGPFVKKLFLSLYLVINIIPAVLMLNMFAGAINVFMLKKTPSWAIILFLIIIGFLFVKSGIIPMSRMLQLLMLMGLLNYLFTFGLGLPEFEIDNIWPILDASVSELSEGTLFAVGICSELLLPVFLLTELFPEPARYRKSATRGYWTGGFVLMFCIVLEIGMINIKVLENMSFAGISAARIIEIGDFIRGLEVLILMTYQFLCIYKVAMSLYCMKTAFVKIFTVKHENIFLMISAVVVFCIAVFLNSYNLAYIFSLYWGLYILLPFVLIVLSVSALAKKISKIKERSGI